MAPATAEKLLGDERSASKVATITHSNVSTIVQKTLQYLFELFSVFHVLHLLYLEWFYQFLNIEYYLYVESKHSIHLIHIQDEIEHQMLNRIEKLEVTYSTWSTLKQQFLSVK